MISEGVFNCIYSVPKSAFISPRLTSAEKKTTMLNFPSIVVKLITLVPLFKLEAAFNQV